MSTDGVVVDHKDGTARHPQSVRADYPVRQPVGLPRRRCRVASGLAGNAGQTLIGLIWGEFHSSPNPPALAPGTARNPGGVKGCLSGSVEEVALGRGAAACWRLFPKRFIGFAVRHTAPRGPSD